MVADETRVFIENVRARLEYLGWNQNDLAEAIGKTRMRVSDLFKGRCNPTLTTVSQIANALGVDSYVLLMPVRKIRRPKAKA